MHFIFKTILIGKQECDYWLIHLNYLVQIKVWTDVFQLRLQFSPGYFSAIFSKKQACPSQDHPYFYVSPPSSLRMVPSTFHGWVNHFFTMVFRNLIVSFHISRMLLLFSPPSQSSFWWTFCHPTYGSLAVPSLHHHNLCMQSRTKTAATTDVLTQLSEGICFKTFTRLLKKFISWIFFLQSVWDVMDYGLADFSISPKFWETRGWGIWTGIWTLSRPWDRDKAGL